MVGSEFLKGLYRDLGSHRLLWLFLTVMSALSLADIAVQPVFELTKPVAALYTVFVAIFKATVLTAIYLALRKWTVTRVLAIMAIALYSILAIANAFSYGYYGTGITRKLLLVFFQATEAEAKGMAPAVINNLWQCITSGKFITAVALIFLAGVGLTKIPAKAYRLALCALSLVGAVMATVFCVKFTTGRTAHLLSARVVRYSIAIYRTEQQFREMYSQLRPLPDADTAGSEHLASNIVVVIGESALRSHHSLYGYPIGTTPHLDNLRDSLLVFTDAIGSSCSTSGNMERILTFKNDDATYGDGLDFPTVIDLFKTAGYKTYWLSNQERTGLMSNTGSVLSSMADVITFAGADNSEDALSFRYDEVLLPHISEALADTARHKMIFVHLLGSHVDYSNRYPASFARITAGRELDEGPERPWLTPSSAATIAEYDNSIAYTDSLLALIINKVAAIDAPSLLVYFSDHGENVYDAGNFTGRTRDCAQVPMIIYFNGAYKRQNSALMSRAAAAADYPISTANIVYPLMTLSGTHYSHYDSTRDFMSPDFGFRPRMVDETPWEPDL